LGGFVVLIGEANLPLGVVLTLLCAFFLFFFLTFEPCGESMSLPLIKLGEGPNCWTAFTADCFLPLGDFLAVFLSTKLSSLLICENKAANALCCCFGDPFDFIALDVGRNCLVDLVVLIGVAIPALGDPPVVAPPCVAIVALEETGLACGCGEGLPLGVTLTDGLLLGPTVGPREGPGLARGLEVGLRPGASDLGLGVVDLEELGLPAGRELGCPLDATLILGPPEGLEGLARPCNVGFPLDEFLAVLVLAGAVVGLEFLCSPAPATPGLALETDEDSVGVSFASMKENKFARGSSFCFLMTLFVLLVFRKLFFGCVSLSLPLLARENSLANASFPLCWLSPLKFLV